MPSAGEDRAVILRIISMDDEAAELLAATAGWSLQARFERSLILARAGDGALVSLVRHDLSDGPFAARLSPDAPRDLRAVASVPRLDWMHAARWRPETVPPTDAVDRAGRVRRFRLLGVGARGARAAAPRRGRLARGIDAVADPADLLALESAFAAGDAGAAVKEAEEVAARLAGLGSGLTPSGDDLLCGAMACHAWAELAGFGSFGGAPLQGTGLRATGGAPASAGVGFRSAVAAAAAPRTSRFAAQALLAAARGHVAAPLGALLTSLFRREASVPPDIAPLLAIGETSGSDLLAGVRLAGRALATRFGREARMSPVHDPVEADTGVGRA
jgi:hypothetical protein